MAGTSKLLLALVLSFGFALSASAVPIQIGTFGVTVTDAVANQLGLWSDQASLTLAANQTGTSASSTSFATGGADLAVFA
jgi:hypothetical protein